MSEINQIKSKIKEIDELLMSKLLDYLLLNEPLKIASSDYIKCYAICSELIKGTKSQPIEELYKYIKEKIDFFIFSIHKKLVTESEKSFLTSFHHEVENTKIFTLWLERVFKILGNVKDVNMTLYSMTALKKNCILPLKIMIFNTLNYEINHDRDGKSVDRNFIRSIIDTLECCEIEEPAIEKIDDSIVIVGRVKEIKIHSLTDDPNKRHFSTSTKVLLRDWLESELESVKKYAIEKSTKEIKICSAPEYISSALKYCLEEDNRKFIYLPKEVHKRLDEINYTALINDNLEALSKMDSGIKFMFSNDKKNDLKNVYDLYIRYPTALNPLMKEMKSFIVTKGEEIYKNQEIAKDPTKFVPALIKFKKESDLLVNYCFQDNYKLLDCKTKSFSQFMNKEHYSKQLANYCDFLMKMELKGKNDDQIEDYLQDVINIFRCVTNKVVFQYEYVKKLSERMLNKKTVSIVAEKNLISKLKAEQGVTYVNRFSSIFEDLEKSDSLNDRFRKNKESSFGKPSGIDFNCKVLQNGAWEIDSMREFKFGIKTLSPALFFCQTVWESFYKKIHDSHNLHWVYGAVSTVEINFYILLLTIYIG